jgi:hypothetical protein
MWTAENGQAVFWLFLMVNHPSLVLGNAAIAAVLAKGPVSCALMSGLWGGVRRWPSWVCAHVSGTYLSGVLGAHGC